MKGAADLNVHIHTLNSKIRTPNIFVHLFLSFFMFNDIKIFS